MCDFDIASFRNQSVKRLKKKKPKSKAKAKEEDRDAKENGANEFALRLQKRRLLGLDVTDSESSSSDSDSGTKKKGRKKKPKLEYQAFAKLMRSDSSDDDDTEKNNSNNSRKDASSSSAAQEAAENDGESKPEQKPEKEEGPYIDPDLILLSDEELTETPSHSRRPTTRSHRLQLEEQRPSTTPEKKSLSPDIPTMPLDDLDPELAMLAASPVESTSDTGPRKVQIKVQFINLQTTDDPNLRAFLNSISKPVKVIVMDNEPFDLMLTHYCKRKLLKKDEMILVYQDVPVVLRATPASLNMLPDTKNIVYVYKRADYERKIAQEAQEKEERFRRLAIDPTSEEFIGKYLPEEPRPSGEPVEEDKRMLIKLRGKDKHDVTLRVKKNTLLRNVVKHYIQVRKLDSSMEDKISLSFEGEVLSLDDTIENTELEDQDMISVTIKT